MLFRRGQLWRRRFLYCATKGGNKIIDSASFKRPPSLLLFLSSVFLSVLRLFPRLVSLPCLSVCFSLCPLVRLLLPSLFGPPVADEYYFLELIQFRGHGHGLAARACVHARSRSIMLTVCVPRRPAATACCITTTATTAATATIAATVITCATTTTRRGFSLARFLESSVPSVPRPSSLFALSCGFVVQVVRNRATSAFGMLRLYVGSEGVAES